MSELDDKPKHRDPWQEAAIMSVIKALSEAPSGLGRKADELVRLLAIEVLEALVMDDRVAASDRAEELREAMLCGELITDTGQVIDVAARSQGRARRWGS
jgi:hypothetical protein